MSNPENYSVIVSAARTPIGSFLGSLASVPAPKLGAVAIQEAVKRAGIKGELVEEVIMGNVLTAAEGQAPARQAVIFSGLPKETGALTIGKVCGSGLKAVMLADQMIRAGDRDVVVAGGMESMSLAPYALPKAREGLRMGNAQVIDTMVNDGLWDVVFMVGQHPASHYQAFSDTGGACLSEIFARIPAAFHNDNVTVYFYDTFTVQGDTFAHTGNGGSGAPWEGEGAGYVLQGTHFLGAGFDTVAIDPADQAALFLDTAPSGIRDYAWNGQHRLLTRGEFASTYLGVPIHEIGHAFYLGHVFSDTDGDGVENNLMGNGFRRFGGRYGMPGPDAHPTILAPESAAQLDTALMFNQPDPFDISASTHPLVWR
ncbi:hypothetical protein EDM76_11330 [bacterium]|nr:MAG: hypothetical protein EDM76_11330 [bacterium]